MEFLPSPRAMIGALYGLLTGDALLLHVIPSVFRVLIALTISAALGIPAGYLASGRFILSPIVSGFISITRFVPPTAFIGLLVLGFGIGAQTAIALMVIGIAPYVAIMSADAFRSVPAEHVDVARAFGATGDEIAIRVVIPFVLPRLVDALKVNVGAAWTFLVVAEIIAGNSGIGFLIARAQRFFDVQTLYALLLICGLAGIAMDRAFEAASRYLSRWARYAVN